MASADSRMPSPQQVAPANAPAWLAASHAGNPPSPRGFGDVSTTSLANTSQHWSDFDVASSRTDASSLTDMDSSASLLSSSASCVRTGSSSSASTIRAARNEGNPSVGQRDSHQRKQRATASLAAERAAETARRALPRPRRTVGRRTFVALCRAVDLIVPVDYDANKTTMRQSAIAMLVHRSEEPHQQRDHVAEVEHGDVALADDLLGGQSGSGDGHRAAIA